MLYTNGIGVHFEPSSLTHGRATRIPLTVDPSSPPSSPPSQCSKKGPETHKLEHKFEIITAAAGDRSCAVRSSMSPVSVRYALERGCFWNWEFQICALQCLCFSSLFLSICWCDWGSASVSIARFMIVKFFLFFCYIFVSIREWPSFRYDFIPIPFVFYNYIHSFRVHCDAIFAFCCLLFCCDDWTGDCCAQFFWFFFTFADFGRIYIMLGCLLRRASQFVALINTTDRCGVWATSNFQMNLRCYTTTNGPTIDERPASNVRIEWALSSEHG